MTLVAALLVALAVAAMPVAQQPATAAAVGPRGLAADYWPKVLALEAELRADPGSLRTGARYRELILVSGAHDRAIDLLAKLADARRDSIEAQANLALACIDKVPVSGKIRQALLGREAIERLTAAIAIRPTPLMYYIRGLVNLFYDAIIFNRVRHGVSDLEEALRLQRLSPPRPYHAKVYIALGDGYWKLKDLPKAKAMWSEGLALMPDNEELAKRVNRQGRDLEWTVRIALDPDHRVDTSLKEILDDLRTLGLR